MKPWTLALGLFAYSLSSQGQPLEGLYPGGIAVVTLPEGTESAEFKGYPVWIENNQARIGIPLSETAGPSGITTDAGQWVGFTITDRQYPEQHIQLRNTQQVTPNQRNLDPYPG